MSPSADQFQSGLARPERRSQGRAFVALGGALLALGLATTPHFTRAADNSVPVLEFIEPTNHAVFPTREEIPIKLRAFAPQDVFLTADVFANQTKIATASYCCSLCPCAHPIPGQETILQIPVPREAGMPVTRQWMGWTNVGVGDYRLTARAVGENGTVVEASPVTITVLDLTLHILVSRDGTVVLSIALGSLTTGRYDLEASQDLHTWTSLGPFGPGNVGAFYFDVPPNEARAHRFYRAVHIPENATTSGQ